MEKYFIGTKYCVRVSLINIYNPYSQNSYVSIKIYYTSLAKSVWGRKRKSEGESDDERIRRASTYETNICSVTALRTNY